MMKIALLLLATMAVSTEALSCAYSGDFTLNNALHSSEIVVVARVGADITPEPVPVVPQEIQVNVGNATHPVYLTQLMLPLQIGGYTEPKYYNGYFRNVLSGDYETGKVVIKAGLPCGIGQLKEKTTYLLFGSVRNEKVKGYVGEVPVFHLNGFTFPNKPMKELTKDERIKVKEFANGNTKCEPADCSPQMAFAMMLCPDGVSTAGQSAVCAFKEGTGCAYDITEHTCPVCRADDDCEGDLVCNGDGLCATP